MIGDTDASDPLLFDDEVDAYLTQREFVASAGGTTHNIVAAAADCAGAIAAKYSREFTFGEDGQTFNRSERVGHYLSLEQRLRTRAGGQSVPLHLAGTTTS